MSELDTGSDGSDTPPGKEGYQSNKERTEHKSAIVSVYLNKLIYRNGKTNMSRVKQLLGTRKLSKS